MPPTLDVSPVAADVVHTVLTWQWRTSDWTLRVSRRDSGSDVWEVCTYDRLTLDEAADVMGASVLLAGR